MVDPRQPPGNDNSRLQEVSDALGVLVNWMREEQASDFASETFELIRLHTAINDGQGRQRVMNVARREAARCRGQQDAEPDC